MLNRDSFYICSNCRGAYGILKVFVALETLEMNEISDELDYIPFWADTNDYECDCGGTDVEGIEVGKLPPSVPVGSLVEIVWGENKQRWWQEKQWRPTAKPLQGIITKINEEESCVFDDDGMIYKGKLGFYSVTIMTSPYEYEKETTITIADIGKVLSSGS